MSETNLGTTRLVGSPLQPIIVHVDGADRSALEDIFELRGNCAYLALFDQNDPHGSCYTGMTHRGQDRPRVGPHLREALSIFVVADAGNNFTRDDVEVLERFLYAKVSELTHWKMRCKLPRARAVGEERFADLMAVGSQVMVRLRTTFGLFADEAVRHVATVPRQFEPILHNLFEGSPQGDKVVLRGFGTKAIGVNMGENGFVICAGSIIRAEVVPSASRIHAARREELLFNGQLMRLDDEHLVVRRDLWRRSPTAAAKFATGSSASAGDWRPVTPSLRLVRP